MTNQPDRYERFVVPPDTKKVEYCMDTKITNAATFVIQREDHTVGNVVRMKLHDDKGVWFAGYKIPHPLEHRLVVKVRTNGACTPATAYNRAVEGCVTELQHIKNEFRKQVQELGDAEGVKIDFEPHEHIFAGAGAEYAHFGDTGEPFNEGAVGMGTFGEAYSGQGAPYGSDQGYAAMEAYPAHSPY